MLALQQIATSDLTTFSLVTANNPTLSERQGTTPSRFFVLLKFEWDKMSNSKSGSTGQLGDYTPEKYNRVLARL